MRGRYLKAPWENLDITRRMWGVFAVGAYSNDPLVICRTRVETEEWIAWQKSRGDACVFGGVQVDTAAIDELTGLMWNSEAPPSL